MSAMRCDRGTTCAAYAHGADIYDVAWSPVIVPPAQSVISELDIGHATYVLDVGAGTGALSAALSAAAPNAAVISVDPAPEMLGLAVERRGVTPLLADAMHLPIPGNAVDAVLLAYMLFMLLDPDAGLREACRVLRPDGRVGTVTWANEVPAMAANVWEATLADLEVPAIPAHSNHSGLESTDAIAARLEAARLSPRRLWYEDVEHTFSPDLFWRLRTQHGTNCVRLMKLDARRRSQVLAELNERLAQLEANDYTVRGTVVCAVAQKERGRSEANRSSRPAQPLAADLGRVPPSPHAIGEDLEGLHLRSMDGDSLANPDAGRS